MLTRAASPVLPMTPARVSVLIKDTLGAGPINYVCLNKGFL